MPALFSEPEKIRVTCSVYSFYNISAMKTYLILVWFTLSPVFAFSQEKVEQIRKKYYDYKNTIKERTDAGIEHEPSHYVLVRKSVEPAVGPVSEEITMYYDLVFDEEREVYYPVARYFVLKIQAAWTYQAECLFDESGELIFAYDRSDIPELKEQRIYLYEGVPVLIKTKTNIETSRDSDQMDEDDFATIEYFRLMASKHVRVLQALYQFGD